MSYNREVTTFPLSPAVLGKLLRAGFHTVSCLASLEPSTLSKCTGITLDEADQVLQVVCQDVTKTQQTAQRLMTRSALDLQHEEQSQESIVTFCEGLDSMLRDGVPLSRLTEFCGASGSGKTQICMQLAVDAHIPEHLGGVNGEVVYIDTEGCLVVERLTEMAQSAVLHCQQIAASQGLKTADQPDLTVDRILSGIHCFRCQDYYDLMATIQILPKFLSQNKKVKLLVVDSLARPMRQNLEDTSLRQRLLATLGQSLHKMAVEFKVAVVLTNQMTTRIMPREGDSHLIPALGDSWAHVCSARVVLSTGVDGSRVAQLYKSPNRQEQRCTFQITDDGVRDVL